MSLRYVGCIATPRLIPGISAVFEKKSTFGNFVTENLNPTGDKKFLFDNCLDQGVWDIFISIYFHKKRTPYWDPL